MEKETGHEGATEEQRATDEGMPAASDQADGTPERAADAATETPTTE